LIEDLKRLLPLFRCPMFKLGINDLEGVSDGKTQPTCDVGHTSFGFVAVGEIDLWLSNALAQNALQSDIDIEGSESMNVFLQSFGDRKVARLNPDPVIRFRCVSATRSKSITV
jgi:hypothetical protein